jgi:hypothetical protein
MAARLFFELAVVFVGVFSAFLLANWSNGRAERQRKAEIYQAIAEDLGRFHGAGDTANAEGFVRMFGQVADSLEARIAQRLPLEPAISIYGDYWQIELIDAFIESGVIREVDIPTQKRITRFRTGHRIFLHLIDDFNRAYYDLVTLHYDNGVDAFYEPDANRLKPKYRLLPEQLRRIQHIAQMLVGMAGELGAQVEQAGKEL